MEAVSILTLPEIRALEQMVVELEREARTILDNLEREAE